MGILSQVPCQKELRFDEYCIDSGKSNSTNSRRHSMRWLPYSDGMKTLLPVIFVPFNHHYLCGLVVYPFSTATVVLGSLPYGQRVN